MGIITNLNYSTTVMSTLMLPMLFSSTSKRIVVRSFIHMHSRDVYRRKIFLLAHMMSLTTLTHTHITLDMKWISFQVHLVWINVSVVGFWSQIYNKTNLTIFEQNTITCVTKVDSFRVLNDTYGGYGARENTMCVWETMNKR